MPTWPRRWEVAIIRLLLLTGCRKSEILTLRWSDYREGRLFLRNSKTGPRTVWLSQPARDLLDGLERTGQWVFPAARGRGPRNKGWLEGFWDEARAEAGLRGVRLHDLRHTHASIALRQGETVLTIARLLGHQNPETTLKYTHLVDKMVMDAAENGRISSSPSRRRVTSASTAARFRTRNREYCPANGSSGRPRALPRRHRRRCRQSAHARAFAGVHGRAGWRCTSLRCHAGLAERAHTTHTFVRGLAAKVPGRHLRTA